MTTGNQDANDPAPTVEARWTSSPRPMFRRGDRVSECWKDLSQGAPPCPAFFYDYLRYQTPLTTDTGAEGVFLEQTSLPEVGAAITPGRFREIVEAEIQALAGHPSVFHLSAGLDSSLLVLLAGRLLDRENLLAVSCRTLGRGATQELDIAQRVADEAGVPFTVYDFTEVDIFAAGVEFMAKGPGYPLAHPSHLARFLMDREIAKTAGRTVVTGRGPDEVLGGYIWQGRSFANEASHHPRVQATDPAQLDALFIHPVDSRARVNYLRHFQNGYGLTSRARYDLLTICEHWNVIDAALARSLNLTYHMPFLNAELIQGCLSLPEDKRTFQAPRGKEFMLAAYKHIYPDYLLAVPKQGLSFDISAYLVPHGAREVMRHIYDDSAYNQSQFHRSAVERMVEETINGRQNYGWQIWSLYLIHLTAKWLLEGQNE